MVSATRAVVGFVNYDICLILNAGFGSNSRDNHYETDPECFALSVDLARIELSALRIPSARIASPLCSITSPIKLFDGLIFKRDVHHLNKGLGAG